MELQAKNPILAIVWMAVAILTLSLSKPALAAAGQPTECDQLAGHPSDPQRVGAGVTDGSFKSSLAIRACVAAVKQDSESGRLHFQLGRAYWLSIGSREMAVDEFNTAADLGSAAALAYLAEIAGGKGRLQAVDMDLAMDYANRSVEGGFAPAKAIVQKLKMAAKAGQNGLVAESVASPDTIAPAQLYEPINISAYTAQGLTANELGYCAKLANAANAKLGGKRAGRPPVGVERAPTEAEVCLAVAFRHNDVMQAGARAMQRQKELLVSRSDRGDFKNRNPSPTEYASGLATILGAITAGVATHGGAMESKFQILEFQLYGCGKNYGGAGYFCDYYINENVEGGMAGAVMEGLAGFREPGRGQRGSSQLVLSPGSGVWTVLPSQNR